MSKLAPPPTHDLALFDGGPLVRSLRWARLRGDELSELRWHRCAFLALITWVPLLLLAALEGQALNASTNMPFLLDASVHVRFLIALPLLILAEIGVDARVRDSLRQFVERDIVPQSALPHFRGAVASAVRMRDSWLAEVVILLYVLFLAIAHHAGLYVSLNEIPAGATSWHGSAGVDGSGRSLAGSWFDLISMPIFQFLTLRWYYRILIWAMLLWRISRLDLQLVPTNPDRVAGLGFIGQTSYAYIPLALGHGAMLSSLIANRILYGTETLTHFQIEIALMVTFVFFLVLGPLLPFARQLTAAKLRGNAEYGAFAGRVVDAFDKRWLRDEARDKSELLNVAEVSAMTDLDTTLGIIREMRYVPFTREAAFWIAVAVLAPMLPLLLTAMPIEELIGKLLEMLL